MAVIVRHMATTASERGDQLTKPLEGPQYSSGQSCKSFVLQVVQLLKDSHDGEVTSQAQLTLIECLRSVVCLQYPPERNYCRC